LEEHVALEKFVVSDRVVRVVRHVEAGAAAGAAVTEHLTGILATWRNQDNHPKSG
jgi:hypothetical protein